MQEIINRLLPIKTERLVIRKTTKNDIDFILKIDKQEDTQKYLGGIKNKTREERLIFLEKKEQGSSLTVYLNDVPIGFFGIKVNLDSAELSYIFDSDYTCKGYCTEVVKEAIDISFNKLKLNKLYAYCKEENIASIKVLEKNGFKENGTKDEFIYYELRKEV